MDELIRKQDVIKEICEDIEWLESQGCTEIPLAERKERDVDIIKNLPSANVDFIKKIEEGIKATGTADEYSIGMCNGMKWCKSLLDGKEPMYYAVQPKLTHDTVQPEITHEQAIDYLHKTGWLQSHDRIMTEHEEMYKKAFSVACELLIGANLFGVTEETMFKEIMDKEGIVSSHSYEKYILDNLSRLTGEDYG